MTRVSDNNSSAALNHSLNRTKRKLEDLQLKGSTLKRITRPSDDPASNVEALSLSNSTSDNKQYIKNISFAMLNIQTTDDALEQIEDILIKAKEIAIGQASDLYGADIRKNVANETRQLYRQALSIGNKRVGNRYIFGGFSTLNPPFDKYGNYSGDSGHTTLELSKDFFVPINLNGEEVFFNNDDSSVQDDDPIAEFEQIKKGNSRAVKRENINQKNNETEIKSTEEINRELASNPNTNFKQRSNIFSQLSSLTIALENNDKGLIQDLLEKMDDSISRVITLRTRIGSSMTNAMRSEGTLERENLNNATRKSDLMDADIASLFTDINSQKAVLKTSYQASQAMLNSTLLDFLR